MFDGFIALACVIKGKTSHFDLITQAVTKSIMDLSIRHKKPIGNAVITCLNKRQANERLHKGRDAAIAVCDILCRGVSNDK